ncbi:hypothetical protein HY993_01620 [Candidatus Micrarchaeota archaeon]|nr:hypothetical protein [Candidatus Micrarchaeota archaeon]
MPSLFNRRGFKSEQKAKLPQFENREFTLSYLRRKTASGARKPIREQAADLVERHGFFLSFVPLVGSVLRFSAEKLFLAPRLQRRKLYSAVGAKSLAASVQSAYEESRASRKVVGLHPAASTPPKLALIQGGKSTPIIPNGAARTRFFSALKTKSFQTSNNPHPAAQRFGLHAQNFIAAQAWAKNRRPLARKSA